MLAHECHGSYLGGPPRAPAQADAQVNRVLVANKCDSEATRQVSVDEGRRLAVCIRDAMGLPGGSGRAQGENMETSPRQWTSTLLLPRLGRALGCVGLKRR